jgi:hypothetical protein
MSETKRVKCDKTHDDLGNTILCLIEKKKMCNPCVKEVLWSLLDTFYEEELVEDPKNRDDIIEDIEEQKKVLLCNIFGEEIEGGRYWLEKEGKKEAAGDY